MLNEGDFFKVTIRNFKGYEWFYFFEREQEDGYFVLSLVKLIRQRGNDLIYKRHSNKTIVEKNWFDKKLTGRKIHLL